MKQLNISKLNSVDNNILLETYKEKLMEANHFNILSDLKIRELQNLIQRIYNEHPEAIPAEYLIEEGKHVNDK